jgi:hypothetical protein
VDGSLRVAAILCLLVTENAPAQDSWHGTAVAVMRTPREIAIAADSRVVRSDSLSEALQVCKIRRAGGIYFVAHNLVEDPASGFDIYEIADQACREGTTISAKAQLFDSLVVGPLIRALVRIRTMSPGSFRKHFVEQAASGIIFAGFLDHVPVLIARRLVVVNPDSAQFSLSIVRRECPGVWCMSGTTTFFVAPDEAVSRFRLAYPYYLRMRPAEVVQQFVEMRIRDHVPDVGPPVDVVRITERGAEWIRRKAGCAEE